MNKDIFELRPDDEFIVLVKLLKLMQIAQTGGHAKLLVEEGAIYVNGEQEYRKRRKLRAGDEVVYIERRIEILESSNKEMP